MYNLLIVWPFCLVHVMGCASPKVLLLRIDNLSTSTLTGFAGTTIAGRCTKLGDAADTGVMWQLTGHDKNYMEIGCGQIWCLF